MTVDSVPDISQLLRKQFVIDHRQQDAFIKLKKGFPNARVFAFESPKFKPSCRKFLADDLRKFYLWYRSCDARCRHFYEIILENMPCRLYFDLEYYKEFNENMDAEATLDKFLNLCCRCMSDLLGYKLDRNTSFLILDSSTPSKFSSHVIVHMPEKKLFPSNVALKPLVKRICQQMIIEDIGIIKEADGTSKFLCDLSVYSRNRNFRLFLSSKCGKDAILKLADYCTFYEDLSPVSNAQIFLDALIIPKDYNLYDIINVPDMSLPVQYMEKKLDCVPKTTHLDSGVSQSAMVYDLQSGQGESPFPELDSYMLSLFKKLNPAAGIRVWRLIMSKKSGERIIQYQLKNCRYCYNKKREHKSQNVYWSVHLDTSFCVQRCFDVVDCYKFSSERFPIPNEVAEKISSEIGPVFHQLCKTVIPPEDSYCLEDAYSESFYSSMYDRLFQEILFKDSQEANSKDDI